MRIASHVAAALLASFLAGAGSSAMAAPLNIADEFQTVCVANRTAPAKAISTAMARGFSLVSGPTQPTVGSSTTLTRMVDGRKWVVRLDVKAVPQSPTMPAAISNLCSIGGYETGTAGGDALRRWAGVTPMDPDPANTTFLFTESGGRHQPLPTLDDAGLGAAVEGGGLYIMAVSVKDGLTIATLSRNVPAP
ncbi:MAG: hypothetical protein GC145_17185 [Caulobacter sp.]|nr:hypothetical protein [Caulobacter sp.]